MEHKIGEIFEYNGEWYQCVKGDICADCTFAKKHCNENPLFEVISSCSKYYRKDATSVIFKKLEKVGEPYIIGNKLIQRYKIYPTTYHINVYGWYYHNLDVKSWTIDIQIKQNKKEDMEEKKIQLKQEDIDYLTRKIRYLVYKTNDYDRTTEEIMNLFIPSDTEHSSSEKIGKNLKPFDLEAAKQGKPVCTRDGRKARIICFDRFCCDEISTIVACVLSKDGKDENVIIYSSDGFMADKQHPYADDLMMLPEKKKGWINIYNADTTFYYVDGRVFETKDEAVKEAKEEVEKEQREKNEYIDTIRVEWEE